MAVLDPVKLVIDNYPEGQVEYLDVANNLENEELGQPYSSVLHGNFILSGKILWKSRRRNISVCIPGNEVRLMNAYFVKCTGFEKDEDGNITVVHCTYDPETKGGKQL